nr:uncharacterized protein LOC106617280 [Bactrocera oleae]
MELRFIRTTPGHTRTGLVRSCEILTRPLYNPDLARSNFYLFLAMALDFVGAKFTAREACTPISDDKPFPLVVRVLNCEIPLCDVIKGTVMIFEIDFFVMKYVTKLTTLLKATTLGITVPYELPNDVRDVCSNLLHEDYTLPLYTTEDMTYLFSFCIGNYLEISVKVE